MMPRCPRALCLSDQVCRHGSFIRSSDSKQIQRYRCKSCKRSFSSATTQRSFGQHNRRVNATIRHLLCSGMSIRRIAKILCINRKTVVRKLAWMAQWAQLDNLELLAQRPQVTEVQFDDLESFEHTKCKPLSVSMAVDASCHWILGFEVSSTPAKGRLAQISRKKYGKRPNERPAKLHRMLESIQPFVTEEAAFSSDKDPLYPRVLKRVFPQSAHRRFKGRRPRDIGQGELKVGPFDPLFPINHSFAKLRANINRLIRKTWCTTKKAERLAQHLAVFVHYHNTYLLKKS